MNKHNSYHFSDGKSVVSRILIAGLISILIGFVFLWTSCPSCIRDTNVVLRNIAYSLMLGYGLFSFGFVFNRLEKRYVSWIGNPIKSLLLVILFLLLYGSVVIIGVNYIWHVLIGRMDFPTFIRQTKSLMILESVVFYIIALWFYARSFFFQWRAEVENKEKLKHEALYLQYEALKTQVNPHFLFNSLNALNALIDIDKESAKKFSLELSGFYRDLLQLKGKEIIPLKEELVILNRYLYLQKIRFGDKFKFTIKNGEVEKAMVIPLSVQMMVENVFKHNIISADDVLNITLDIRDDIIIISNTYLPKASTEQSMGIGLKNLKERVEYLTGKELQSGVVGDKYRVVLPIIFM